MSNTKNQSRFSLLSIFKFAIGWPLSAVALFFVGKIILSNGTAVLSSLSELNLSLLASGIICFLFFYFIRTYVWKTILKEQGYDMPQRKASLLWEISELRRFVPGNIWSFLSRATLFCNTGIPTKTIAKGLIIETQSFLLSCFIISTLGIFLYPKILPVSIPDIILLPFTAVLLFSTVLFINHSLLTKYIKGMLLSKIKVLFPNFSPKTNAYILLVSVLYLFLFGFGTYLTITSLTFISPEHSLELSMFFVVALLIGYLSFLTPMGLGVRESAMIAVLSQFIPLATAGLVSIFARIVLIISELSFLLFTYFWSKTKNKFITFLENFTVLHKQQITLGVFIILYILYFTVTSFLRYDNFYTGRFDLGNMDQTVWNTINGRIFELTDPNGTQTISRLAYHTDFILILLAPFYLIWEHPKMLLLIQTVVLAIGNIFIYKIAMNIIKNRNLSFVFAIAFLLNPAVQYTNLYDFHPVTLATTFLLGTFYFLLKKQYGLFLLFAILSAITKEQVWVIIAIFGLYISFFQSKRHSEEPSPHSLSLRERARVRERRKIFGLIVILVSVLIFYFLIWHAIPNALGSEHFALSYYSDFGDSPAQIVKNFFLEPQKIITTILQKNQQYYLLQLFLPLGLTSLLSPFLLIFSLPDLFINLLSSKPQLHQIYYQYSATITPFIFISAIYGIKNLITWFPKLSTFSTFYILLSTIYCANLFGPLPFSKSPNIDMFTKPQKNKSLIENFISNIPSKYSVAATNSVGSHLAHRQKLYNVPLGINHADFIVFLLDDHFAQPSLKAQYKMVEKIKNDKNYVETIKIDNFIVFEKLVK